jgi:hypothetical protein
MTFAAFFVIDNVFLGIVSQQIDKINVFQHQTTNTNMRDFINSGLVTGSLPALTMARSVAVCWERSAR